MYLDEDRGKQAKIKKLRGVTHPCKAGFDTSVSERSGIMQRGGKGG